MDPVIRLLERVAYRAPLAVRAVDGVTNVDVTDGLAATAWKLGEPATPHVAQRSQVSGILGFGRLPVPWSTTHAVVPAGSPATWPATTPASYLVRVEDMLGRYLAVLVRASVPVSAPVVVPLSSAPPRPAPGGFGTVRGEVHAKSDGRPLAWSLVRVDTGAAVVQTVADRLGRFTLHLPYPEALPPLTGSPPSGPGLSAVVWPVTVTLRCQPGALVFTGARPADPPELGSITGQAAAQLFDGGGDHPSIAATLTFGTPLVLALTAVPA
jgi:hypothetical protein